MQRCLNCGARFQRKRGEILKRDWWRSLHVPQSFFCSAQCADWKDNLSVNLKNVELITAIPKRWRQIGLRAKHNVETMLGIQPQEQTR